MNSLALVDGLMGRHDRGYARLVAATARLDGVPPNQALALVLQLATGGIYRQCYGDACAAAERARAIAETIGTPAARAASAAMLALAEALAGRTAAAAGHREEAVAVLDAMSDEEVAPALAALSPVASSEVYLDHLDDARRLHLRPAA